MSWCCLISGDERSAIKIEGYARNDDAREALSKLCGAFKFYAPYLHSSLLTPHLIRKLTYILLSGIASYIFAAKPPPSFLIPNFKFSFKQSFRARSRDGMFHTYYQRTNE